MNIQLRNSADAKTGEFAFTDSDFKMISDLAKTKFGLDLQSSKKPLVYSRLAKRLRALKLSSFEAYCDMLEKTDGENEKSHLLSALTTNVTHFFRESHHFDYLHDKVVPGLCAAAKAGRPVRIWSAACSAGQEAFSIAATLYAANPDVGNLDIRILATDIDPQMIAKAKAGLYPKDQSDAIPNAYRKTMLEHRSEDSMLQMAPKLRDMISFAELNLIEKWPMKRRFDVIFCRNAAIYFDKPTQSTLWQDFAKNLQPGGHLMIGHSERLSGPATQLFESVGITTYQRHQTNDASRVTAEQE